VTIQEAARRLGISEGAVRKRVTRGTLEHAKEADGRIYVYLDRDRHRVDDVQDTGVDPNSGALISRLEDEVEFLRDQVRRQLSAPSEAPEDVQRAAQSEEPPESTGGPENQSSRPWWRRIIGR
jgi:DNA-binding Lrp family transcriptional regulator